MLGDKIRSLRKQRGLSQVELGRILGVSQRAISGYESQQISPSPEVLKQLATIFNVSVDYLLSDESASLFSTTNGSTSNQVVNWSNLALKLRRVREERQWTVEQSAQRVGVSAETWSQWEQGTGPISIDAVHRVARALGLPLTTLLNGLRTVHHLEPDPLDKPLRDLLPARPIPILGRVVAGVPVAAQEDRNGEIWIPQGEPGDYAVEVHGDSMIGAGIQPGDIVIVEQVPSWQDVPSRTLVVALVDGEQTLKWLIREPAWEDNRWILRAANPQYQDRLLDPRQDRIVGIVRSIHRRPPMPPSDQSPASPIDPLADLTPEQRVLIEEQERLIQEQQRLIQLQIRQHQAMIARFRKLNQTVGRESAQKTRNDPSPSTDETY